MKKLLDDMESSIATVTIRVKLKDLGSEVYAQEVVPTNAWGSPLNHLRRVELNYHPGPTNFFGDQSEAEKTLFHELTHQHGAVDGGDAYNDAHMLEYLMEDEEKLSSRIRGELFPKFGKKNCPFYPGQNASWNDQWPDNIE